jgi:hypothetical protein
MNPEDPERIPYRKQVSRFTVLGPLPPTAEGLAELVEALMQFTVAQAEQITTRIIRGGEFARPPNYADITNVGRDLFPPEERGNPHGNCAWCGGSGFKIIQAVHRGREVEAAVRCDHSGTGQAPDPPTYGWSEAELETFSKLRAKAVRLSMPLCVEHRLPMVIAVNEHEPTCPLCRQREQRERVS